MDERFYPQEPPDNPVDKPEKEYEPDTQLKPLNCDCGCLEGKLFQRLALQQEDKE
jgi:hypothetical protein